HPRARSTPKRLPTGRPFPHAIRTPKKPRCGPRSRQRTRKFSSICTRELRSGNGLLLLWMRTSPSSLHVVTSKRFRSKAASWPTEKRHEQVRGNPTNAEGQPGDAGEGGRLHLGRTGNQGNGQPGLLPQGQDEG